MLMNHPIGSHYYIYLGLWQIEHVIYSKSHLNNSTNGYNMYFIMYIFSEFYLLNCSLTPWDPAIYIDFVKSGIWKIPNPLQSNPCMNSNFFSLISLAQLQILTVPASDQNLAFCDKVDLFLSFIKSFLWIQRNCIKDPTNWKEIEDILRCI